MDKEQNNAKYQKVSLLVENKPGVLTRLIGHIRNEGWNIKSLHVEETEDAAVSRTDITIEGKHTKLALIVDKLIYLDCVIKATLERDGELIEKRRVEATPCGGNKRIPEIISNNEEIRELPAKKAGEFRILTINPGSTSTKLAVYDNDKVIMSATARHDRADLDRQGSVLAQKKLRTTTVIDKLSEYGIKPESLDAIAGRGGLLRPIESGVYEINDVMLRDLSSAAAAVHASALGAVIAADIAELSGKKIPAYVVDPIVVDEMDRNAKLSGMPGIERVSIFHALNQKAIAKRCAADIGKNYNNCRFIVAHLGGGVTVGAHRYGRVVDVNDALSGEGSFTPERTGAIPAVPLIEMCYSGEYTKEEMISRVTKNGGMQSYLGTNDLKAAQKMINYGDEFAALVVDSMAYQVCKEIGAMYAVLEGRVDAIILTGGLAHSSRFTGSIKQRVDTLAPVYVYPGEDEMYSLMAGVLRVLKGEEQPSEYI